jgi:hypothetical protein
LRGPGSPARLTTEEGDMHDRPKARTEHLVTERIDDELVIYDQLSNVAHCLSSDALAIWDRCDGRLTEDMIARQVELSVDVVGRAVAALEERGLLEKGPGVRPEYSRRQAAIRMARIAGAALAGPLIYSVDVGTAAAKASHLAAGCVVTTCGSCTTTTGCPLCGTGDAGHTSTNSMCASGICYCSLVNSVGTAQTVLRCAIGSSCHGDANSNCAGGASGPCGCTTNANCCGNNCASGGLCRSASPTC